MSTAPAALAASLRFQAPPPPLSVMMDPDTLRTELPVQMQAAPRWLLWRQESGRKIPYYANFTKRQGILDSPGDQANFVTLEEALTAMEQRPGYLLGFALGPDGSGNCWQGIDLDHVENHPGHAELAEMLPGYREQSPSGTGCHALGYGRHFAALASNATGIEAYANGRYFTVTGWALGGEVADLAPFVAGTLAPLHGGPRPPAGKDEGKAIIRVTDAQVVELRSALNSINPDDREAWIAMGQALAELGDVGKGIWLDWSQMSTKWQAKDADNWATFRGDHTGYQAVFARAQQGGWVNPASKAASMDRPDELDRLAGRITTPDFSPGVTVIPASDYHIEPIGWLWRGWLAKGKVHILAGAPGTGKTSLAMALAATLTTGSRWPDGTPAEPGEVLIWSGEDDPSDTLIPRMMAAGAVLERVHIVASTTDSEGSRSFDPAGDMPLLAEHVATMDPAPALLIIDPVVSAVAGDSHKNGEVRRALQPLVDLAMVRKIAVLGITHFSKGTAGRDPVERVTGSLAFGALARIVMAAAKMPDEQGGGRILARGKSNIGKDDGGFAYDLEVMELRPGIETTCVMWGEAITGSARDILGQAEAIDDPEERSAWEEARDWLLEELKEGPRKASDVQRSAKGSGITEKSLRTARERLGIKPHKEAFSLHGAWMWKLPAAKMPSEAKMPNLPQESDWEGGHLQGQDGQNVANLPPRCPTPQSLSVGTLGTLGNEGIFDGEVF